MAVSIASTAEDPSVKPGEGKLGAAMDRPAVPADSYGQILRTSAIVGGSSVAVMAIAILRTKALAMMLGPAGFGMLGVLNSMADLARTIAQLGINQSGVRQIADAASSGDRLRASLVATVLRRMALVLGMVGGMLLAVFALPIANFTFGDRTLRWSVALLALAVLFQLLADSQSTLLQGMRRIGDLAKANVLGALLSALATSLLVFALGDAGVAPAVVASAACLFAASWLYSRRVALPAQRTSALRIAEEARSLLQLGLAFMTSALLTMGAAYFVRLVLTREEGLGAAGLYQAAWAVGGMYVAFILQAMGTDFYPRLVAASRDNVQTNRLVNEQVQVSMLLAGSGVLATLTIASWLVRILYSDDFLGAADVLRWICLGMALRVITWPLGYILVAKGKRVLFVAADLTWTLVNIALTVWCVGQFGVAGAGIAFFASYVCHFCVVYPMCRRASGFQWSATNLKLCCAFVLLAATVQAGFLVLPIALAEALGALLTAGAAIASMLALYRVVGSDALPAWMGRLRRRVGR